MSDHVHLFDVHARYSLAGEAVFILRAPLGIIAQLFHLAEGAIQRCRQELQVGEACELFSNGRTRGAWGSLGGREPVHSITVRKTDHIILK